MQINKLQVSFFYMVLIGALVLTFFIFEPFLKVLFLAVVFGVVFNPLYKKLLSGFAFRGGNNLSAFITVLVVLLVILIPFVGLGILVFQEINSAYFSLLADTENNSLVSFFAGAGSSINGILPFDVVPEISLENIQEYASQAYGWVLGHFQVLFTGVFNLLMGIFILILGLFFYLRDGEKFEKVLISLSPLSDTQDQSIIHKMKLAMNSVIKGSLFIAVLQGILAGVGFFVFGIPSAILWGSVAVISAIIPSVGTALVIVPAVIFLFLTKGVAPAAGLLIWGVIIVGLVDNILAPIVLERGIKIHPFFILISVLGGLAFFGPIGFLIGPVILSLLFALIDIYPEVTKKES